MTVVGAGIAHAALVKAATARFGALSGGAAALEASPFVGGSALLKAPSALTHVAVALEGPAAGGPDHAAALVTKHLLAPHGTSFLFAYSGSGAFGLAGAANPAGAGKLAEKLVAALKAPVSDAAFASAKLAAKTQLLVEAEDAGAVLPALAAGHVSAAALDAVTAASLKAFLAKALKSQPAFAAVGPAAALPTYANLRKLF